jgi:hypothetical protein
MPDAAGRQPAKEAICAEDGGCDAGAYTRPLVGSAWAVLVFETTRRIPRKVLALSKVDKCKALL